MPITQSRMLSLLAAAQDYQQAFDQIIERTVRIQNLLTAGQITTVQAISEYEKATMPLMLLRYPFDSPTVIRFESLHFTKEKKRNDRKAQKARENREATRLGQPKPQRGLGGEYGHLGGPLAIRTQQKQLSIEPSLAASAPLSSTMLGRGLQPISVHQAEETPPQSPSLCDLRANEALDAMGEIEEYSPSPLSTEEKAAIDRERENMKEAEEFLPRPGFSVAPALCGHEQGREGESCPSCGTMLPSDSSEVE